MQCALFAEVVDDCSLPHVDDDVGVGGGSSGAHGGTVDLMEHASLEGQIAVAHHERKQFHDQRDVIVGELLERLLLVQKSADELESKSRVDVRIQRGDVGCKEDASLRGHRIQLDIVDERLSVLD